MDRHFEEKIAKLLTLRYQHPNNSVFSAEENALIELYSIFESNNFTSGIVYPVAFFGASVNNVGNAQQSFGAITIGMFSSHPIVTGVQYNLANRPTNLYYQPILNRYYYFLFLDALELSTAMHLAALPDAPPPI